MPTSIAINNVAPSSYKLKQDVLFRPTLDGGLKQGYVVLQNCSQFSIGPTADTTTIPGTMLGNYGQSLDALTQPGDVTITMLMTRQDLYNTVIAMLGEGTAIDESAGGTIAAEAIPAYSGQNTPVAKQNVDWTTLAFLGADCVVVDASLYTVGELVVNTTTGANVGYVHPNSAGLQLFLVLAGDGVIPTSGDVITGVDSATSETVGASISDDTLAVLDTDFSITNDRYVTFPDDGLWQKGVMQVSYDYTGYKADQIAIGAESIVKGEFVMLGTNLVTNQAVEIRLRQANLSPSAETSFVTDGDARSEVALTGIAETPEGESDSGSIIYVAAAAA